MHNQMQNIFLEQIEKFKGVLIATTNLLENIDKAFSRRFNYKIEFKKPNKEQRLSLWNKMLPKNAPYKEGFDAHELADYSLTGGQINLVIKNTAYRVAIREEPLFSLEDFKEEIKAYFTAWENALIKIFENKYPKIQDSNLAKKYVALTQGAIMMMNLYDSSDNYLKVGEKIISLI